MKKLTKLLSLALAILMVMSLAATAFATDPAPAPADKTTVITINNAPSNSKFSFYRVLDATQSETNANAVLYSTNDKFRSALQTVINDADATDAQIIDYIEGLTSATAIRQFADKLYDQIVADGIEADVKDQSVSDGSVSSGAVPYGYYLIAQTEIGTSPAGQTDDKSLVMLDTGVSEAKSINAKVDAPSLIKNVKEFDDTTDVSVDTKNWQDAADWDIGDQIPFKIQATISKRYDDYTTYKLVFHDEPSNGLTIESLDTLKASAKVYLIHQNETHANEQILTGYDIVIPSAACGKLNCAFHVEINDLKQCTVKTETGSKKIEAHPGDSVAVVFKMKLDTDAVIGGAGNPNKCLLEFSNDPDGTGTGVTPPDDVIVYTYQFTVNKVDGSTPAKPVKGASFKLSKYVLQEDKSVELVQVGEVKTGTEKTGADGKLESVTYNWVGLDAGDYLLQETVTPDGYTPAKDIKFRIDATYNNSSTPSLTNLEFYAIGDDGSKLTGTDIPTFTQTKDAEGKFTGGATNIVNLSGSVLPATGGIGTTLFYVFGSILAIGAGVLLVSKKRMGTVD